jgi:hypothetical protein
MVMGLKTWLYVSLCLTILSVRSAAGEEIWMSKTNYKFHYMYGMFYVCCVCVKGGSQLDNKAIRSSGTRCQVIKKTKHNKNINIPLIISDTKENHTVASREAPRCLAEDSNLGSFSSEADAL